MVENETTWGIETVYFNRVASYHLSLVICPSFSLYDEARLTKCAYCYNTVSFQPQFGII